MSIIIARGTKERKRLLFTDVKDRTTAQVRLDRCFWNIFHIFLILFEVFVFHIFCGILLDSRLFSTFCFLCIFDVLCLCGFFVFVFPCFLSRVFKSPLLIALFHILPHLLLSAFHCTIMSWAQDILYTTGFPASCIWRTRNTLTKGLLTLVFWSM